MTYKAKILIEPNKNYKVKDPIFGNEPRHEKEVNDMGPVNEVRVRSDKPFVIEIEENGSSREVKAIPD